MPTLEQIKLLLKSKSKRFEARSKNQYRRIWCYLSSEELDLLLCPQCRSILVEHLGGTYVYIKSSRGAKVKMLCEVIKDLMVQDITTKEIYKIMKEKYSITENQFYQYQSPCSQ